MEPSYELFDHTADIGIRAVAPTMAGLVAPAGQGLYAVIGELIPAATGEVKPVAWDLTAGATIDDTRAAAASGSCSVKRIGARACSMCNLT